jgi:hypothetical protein
VGVRSNTTRAEFARASVEGVVCGLLDGLDALAVAGVSTGGRLYILGGGAKSSAYRQTVADLAKRAVVVPASEEHVATGAAVQAAAVVQGLAPEALSDIAAAWGLGAGTDVAGNSLLRRPNLKSVGGFGELCSVVGPGGAHVGNAGHRRALSGPGKQFLNPVASAGDDRFDPTVSSVAHPTRHPDTCRLLLH